jgi:hypothetical protein
MPITELKHGAKLETVTRAEVEQLLRQYTTRQETRERVRAAQAISVDATGNAILDVYDCPIGYEFELRRVFFNNGTADPGAAGAIALAGAGRFAAYLRSGQIIEYALPNNFNNPAVASIPGVQTWGSEQGPYLSNGELLSVQFAALPANTRVTVQIEGILTKGGSLK